MTTAYCGGVKIEIGVGIMSIIYKHYSYCNKGVLLGNIFSILVVTTINI